MLVYWWVTWFTWWNHQLFDYWCLIFNQWEEDTLNTLEKRSLGKPQPAWQLALQWILVTFGSLTNESTLCFVLFFGGISKSWNVSWQGNTPYFNLKLHMSHCYCYARFPQKKPFLGAFTRFNPLYTNLSFGKRICTNFIFVGGFKYFSVSSLFENMIQFDVRIFFKSGWNPPTSHVFSIIYSTPKN